MDSLDYLEKAKLYRDAHKSQAKMYREKYYAEHKEKLVAHLLKQVVCECGFECALVNLKRHQKSKLHVKKLTPVDVKPNAKEIKLKLKIEKLEQQLIELKGIL